MLGLAFEGWCQGTMVIGYIYVMRGAREKLSAVQSFSSASNCISFEFIFLLRNQGFEIACVFPNQLTFNPVQFKPIDQ